ncbi:MAG TPA: FKBP-type peptidyl-prolyl cis-trans isomerase, partial [Terrimesophilobacter sp.]|nr:FKBP-type peptidyl-prolyl cis-trans isomerase [Terrimesophilobacter sp.]
EGMPQVTLIAEGEPVVTIPDEAPPSELQIAVLKRGDGDVVAEGSTVLVHYVGVSWDTKEIFDSSWTRPQAATFSLGGVVPGFADAIAGETVGSQVIAVIPPELAYGPKTGAENEHQLAGQTLVFVVDILFAVGPEQ